MSVSVNVSLPANQTSGECINIPIVMDDAVEGDEYFEVVFVIPTEPALATSTNSSVVIIKEVNAALLR